MWAHDRYCKMEQVSAEIASTRSREGRFWPRQMRCYPAVSLGLAESSMQKLHAVPSPQGEASLMLAQGLSEPDTKRPSFWELGAVSQVP